MSRSLQLTSGPHLSLMLSFLHCLDFYHPELSAQQILVPNFWKVFKYLNEPQTEVATSTVQCELQYSRTKENYGFVLRTICSFCGDRGPY